MSSPTIRSARSGSPQTKRGDPPRELDPLRDRLELEFSGEIWYWRGPSPFHYVTVPEHESSEIRAVASMVSYGWGVIPVMARVGTTRWTTSLFPKDGAYLVPIKAVIRKAERLELGDTVRIRLTIEV